MPTARAATWRTAIGSAKDAAYAELYTAVLERVAAKVRNYAIPVDDQKDVVQEATLKVLAHIAAGSARVGAETGFSGAAGFTAAMDWFRRADRAPLRLDLDDGSEAAEPDPEGEPNGPEEQIVTREEQDARTRLVTEILALLQKAPRSYRDTLLDHYLKERSITELLGEELRGRIRNGKATDPPTEEDVMRARNAVDNRLRNARNWVRAKLAAGRKRSN